MSIETDFCDEMLKLDSFLKFERIFLKFVSSLVNAFQKIKKLILKDQNSISV